MPEPQGPRLPVPRSSSGSAGWGAPTVGAAFAALLAVGCAALAGQPATMDWCEPNNDVTTWVKEFRNTLSMLPWLASSAAGLHRASGKAGHQTVVVMFALSLAIAVGSVLFHSFLTRSTQAADELPMFYMGIYGLRLLDPLGVTTGIRSLQPVRAYADELTLLASAVFTAVYCGITQYELFVVPYILLMAVWLLNVLLRIARAVWYQEPHARIGATGAVSLVLAVATWFVEHHSCRPWLPLHAVWHLLLGVATYSLIRFTEVVVL